MTNRFHAQGCHINCLDSSCPCDNKCNCSRSEEPISVEEQMARRWLRLRDAYIVKCISIRMSRDEALGILAATEYFIQDKEKALRVAQQIAMQTGTDSARERGIR